MKRSLFFMVGFALLTLPLIGFSRWGPSGCDLASAQPAVVGNPSFRWVMRPDVPDEAYLYNGNSQVGGWSAATQKYRPIINGIWGAPTDSPPIAPPTNLVRKEPSVEEKGGLKLWQLDGVNIDKLSKQEKHHLHSDQGKIVITESDIQPLLAVLADDSKKLWLSVWSKDPAKRQRVVADMRADPALWKWVQERCHLWTGEAARPDHFLEKDRDGQPIRAIDGDPTISLQDSRGVELWHDAGYKVGAASLQDLRKRDPDYRPDRTPGPGGLTATEANVMIPAILLGGLILLMLPPRKEDP